MKNLKYILTFLLGLIPSISYLVGYNQPAVNLGQTNILDGGPLRLAPGWYWKEYLQYYHADKFIDSKGNLLGALPSPQFDVCALVTQFAYQTNKKIFDGSIGFGFILPYVLVSHIERNRLDIKTSGSGLGDFVVGIGLQWDPVMHHGKPFFITRILCNISFPTGKNYEPAVAINPGNRVYAVNPYWAATLYLTPDWAVSWRLHYLWSSKNSATDIQAGQVMHMNYDMEYQVLQRLWLGITGYFLRSLNNNKLHDKNIPQSREQVLGIGSGLLYTFKSGYLISSYLYGEELVKNRTKGIRFIIRMIKHF